MEACRNLLPNRLRNLVRAHNRECREYALLTTISLLVIGVVTLVGLQLIQWGGIPPGQEFFHSALKFSLVSGAVLGGGMIVIPKIWETCILHKQQTEGRHEIIERLKKELNIKDIGTRVKEIYGDNPMPIPMPIVPLSITCFSPSYESYLRLSWLKDEEVLALKISKILTYSQEQIWLLLHRLYLIESKREEGYVFIPQSTSNNFDIENATLSEFRQLGFWQLDVPELFKKLNKTSPILGLLSPNQIKQLLNRVGVEITNETMNALFPFDLEQEPIRTRFLLKDLSIETIIHRFDSFSGYHLRCLSCKQLQSPQFPWEKVIRSKKKISELFDCFNECRSQKTQRILQQLNMAAIQTLVEVLPGSSLRLLSPTQLQSKEFPWNELAQEKIDELFGHKAIYNNHSLGKMVLNQEGLEVQRILQLLDSNTLKNLMERLKAVHLLLLSPEQLQSKDFPWDVVGQEKIDVLFSNTSGLSSTRRIWEYLDEETLDKLRTLYKIPTPQRLLP